MHTCTRARVHPCGGPTFLYARAARLDFDHVLARSRHIARRRRERERERAVDSKCGESRVQARKDELRAATFTVIINHRDNWEEARRCLLPCDCWWAEVCCSTQRKWLENSDDDIGRVAYAFCTPIHSHVQRFHH